MDHQRTVLLVEDDPIVLDAAVETLAEGGCAVRSASSYEEAHARRPGLGIIILSGEVRPEAGKLPDKALFCTKPCAPGALLTLVNQCTEW